MNSGVRKQIRQAAESTLTAELYLIQSSSISLQELILYMSIDKTKNPAKIHFDKYQIN